MLIKNARVFIGKSFINADVLFDKTILAVGDLPGEADIDAAGAYLVPGFVDIHTHGAMGEDFSDETFSIGDEDDDDFSLDNFNVDLGDDFE